MTAESYRETRLGSVDADHEDAYLGDGAERFFEAKGNEIYDP